MKPTISICIPTYNRAKYLKECLDSIVSQFNKNIYRQIEIIISDNNSRDQTRNIVKNYQKKYKNIRYFRNQKNIGAAKNAIKALNYVNGNYIWFFSDDDLHKKGSLSTILSIISKHKPDAMLCNLDLYSKNAKNLLDPNLLRIKQDVYLTSKKELFSFLETKFFLPLDWYITCSANTIISNKLLYENKKIMTATNIFPHSSLIYYNPKDYKIFIIAKPLVIFRGYNRRFGPKNGLKFLIYWYKVLSIHNKNIYSINRKHLSIKFTLLLFLKNTTRQLRLFFLERFRFDISVPLIKLSQVMKGI